MAFQSPIRDMASRFDIVIEDEGVPLGKSGNPSAFLAAWGLAHLPRRRAGARRDDSSRAAMNWSRLQDHRMNPCRRSARQGWHERFWKRDKPGNDT